MTEPYACGHTAPVSNCGGCDPGAVAFTVEDGTGVVERFGPWRRDAGHVDRCACGHLATMHRHDLKTSSPCSTGGCGCTLLRPYTRLYREHRWVEQSFDKPGV